MPRTHASVLESTTQKSHEWLEQLVHIGHFLDEAQAWTALHSVLHALRDRLTVGEAVQLASQFPMLIRGMYFEGWRPSAVPTRERRAADFLDHVRQGFRTNRTIDPMHATRSVFELLQERVSVGEINDVCAMLPKELRELWPQG